MHDSKNKKLPLGLPQQGEMSEGQRGRVLNIEEAFDHFLSISSAHQHIGETANYVAQVRFKLKHGTGAISLNLKRDWLIRAGYRVARQEQWVVPGENPIPAFPLQWEGEHFTADDMIRFARFFGRQSAAAREDGFYCLEKWKK